MSFNIPDKAKVDYSVPTEKFSFDGAVETEVTSIKWIGTIKPCIMNVEPVIMQNKRFEEIQILEMTINSVEHIYEIGKCVFKTIKYPVLLKLNFEDKYLLGTCMFQPGKIDSTENVLKKIQYSHWIRDDFMSPNAMKLIEGITKTLNKEIDLYTMYHEITQLIMNYKISGTSKAHVERLLKDMLGKKINFDEIMNKATPVKVYTKLGGYYSSKKTSNYKFCYDYEELWYCFMNYEKTAKVITNRRYRDIEDLIFSIDDRLGG